uniref:WXG100-like domain-containing protein n=1 Tax=Nocardia shimofusensis TaxID=228596 RepID=UPI000AAA9788
MAELPGYLRWLEWVAGSDWPAGEPEGMWDIAGDWRTAANGLREILGDIDHAKSTTLAAYPQGEGMEKMFKSFDALRSGDNSLEQLAKFFDQIGDSADDVGTEIEYAQLMMISSLALLAAEIAAAWIFPPTAPAAEAVAIGLTRVGIRLLAQRVMNRIVQLTARLVGQRAASFLVRHIALDTIIGTFQEVAIQGYQVQAGHRDNMNWEQVAVTAASSAVGAGAASPFGDWIGKKLPNLGHHSINGAVVGTTAGLVGSVAGFGGSVLTQLGIDAYQDGWDKAWETAKQTEFDPRMLTAGMSNGAMSGASRSLADGFYQNRHPEWYPAPPPDPEPRIGGTPDPLGSNSNGADPAGTNGADPTGTNGAGPANTNGADPTGTNGAGPANTNGADPTGTNGADPANTNGADPTGTNRADPTGTNGADPTGTNGADPTGTDGAADPTGSGTDGAGLAPEGAAPDTAGPEADSTGDPAPQTSPAAGTTPENATDPGSDTTGQDGDSDSPARPEGEAPPAPPTPPGDAKTDNNDGDNQAGTDGANTRSETSGDTPGGAVDPGSAATDRTADAPSDNAPRAESAAAQQDNSTPAGPSSTPAEPNSTPAQQDSTAPSRADEADSRSADPARGANDAPRADPAPGQPGRTPDGPASSAPDR